MDKSDPKAAVANADEIALTLRQMALVDRVIGLEAEVARLNAVTPGASGARDEIARLEAELRAVYASRTWAIGTAILRLARPFRRARG